MMRSVGIALLFSLSLLSSVCAAPSHAVSARHLARRRFHMSWPNRLFGSDRWGIVLGPLLSITPINNGNSPDAAPSGSDPAANPGILNSTPTIDSVTPTVLTVPASAAVSDSVSLSSSSSAISSASSTSTETPSPAFSPTSNAAHAIHPQPSSVASAKTTAQTTATSQAGSSQSPAPASTVTPESAKSPSSPSATSSSEATTATPKAKEQTPSSGTRVSGSDEDAYLQSHNDERAKHGANPLTWSNTLAAAAQTWADKCVFKHSGGSLGPYGENLAAGTGDFTIQAAIGAWNAEQPQYSPSNPQASHWTQVVWKASTQVGCALAANCSGIFPSGPAQYYVCEYFPQGNVIGQFDQNVQD